MDAFEIKNQMPEEKVKRKKSGKKKILVILGILGFVLLVAGVIVWNTPKIVIAHSLTSAIEDFGEREELAFALEMLNGGSLEVNVKGEGLSLDGKVYMNLEEYCLLADSVTYKNSSATYFASCCVSPESIWVHSKNGLPNGVFGLTPGQALKNLDKYCEKNNISKEGNDYDILHSICQIIDYGESAELFEDIFEVTEEVQKERYKLLLEHAEIDVKIKTVNIDGKNVTARVYKILLDERALDEADCDYYEYLAESRAVKKLLEKYDTFFIDMLGGNSKKDDVLDLFDEWIRKAEKAVDNEGCTYTLKLTTSLLTSTMLEFSVFYEWESESWTYDTEMFSVKCDTKGVDKSDLLEFVIYDEVYTYEVKKNDKNRFVAELSSEWLEVEFFYNKERDDFTLEVTEIYEDEKTELVYIEGELCVEKGKIEINSEKVRLNEKETNFSIALCLLKKDEMPTYSYDATALYDSKFEDAFWRIEDDWWRVLNKYF